MQEQTEVSPEEAVGGRQILSFVLDGDWFGVEISGIQEVVEYRDVTHVPRTPAFMLGVINLRGKVIPVVDLRRHFAMGTPAPTVETCIVIVSVQIDGEETALGILADRVHEVVELLESDISPPPRIGSRVRSEFIAGMGRQDENFVILLDLPRIFSGADLQQVVDGTESAAQALDERSDQTP